MTDDKLYTSLSANTIMAILTNHVQRTRLITSSTDKHYSLASEGDFRSVVETSVTNNSSFQNYTHPGDHTIRTTDTPGFKPFTVLESMPFSKKYHCEKTQENCTICPLPTVSLSLVPSKYLPYAISPKYF